MVVIPAPFSVMDAPDTNPAPVAVSVNAGLPAATADGEIDVSAKEPFPDPPVMVSVRAFDVVLSGFRTLMLTVPPLAICAAVTLAVSSVADFTVVVSEIPSHKIVVPLTKFVPVAVRVNPSAPAATVVGEMDDRVGLKTPLNPPHPPSNVERTASRKT